VDDGPAAAQAAPGLSGPQLDAACRAVAALAPQPAIAGPAWWDANAPLRRVTYADRPALPLPLPPWPARRALDFCCELALALAPVHEAGAAHGALRREAVQLRPDGGPIVQVPGGSGGPSDDLHGLGIVLVELLTGRRGHAGLVVDGESGPAAEAAELLEGLLAADPGARPESARAVAARLAEIAATVPDAAVVPVAPVERRRRARLAAAVVLLLVAGGSGAYVAGHRVGPAGPALSPGTVSVPVTPPSP
jgi:hypothetical protein